MNKEFIMSNDIELLLTRFENCEQAKLQYEYCSVDKTFTITLILNGAEFAQAESTSVDDAIAQLDHFLNVELVAQDVPV